MMIHRLKIQPQYLNNLICGLKKSEIRLNDRDYQTGDVLEFDERDPLLEHVETADTEDEYIRFKVTHLHHGLGLQPGYVVLSVERIGES